VQGWNDGRIDAYVHFSSLGSNKEDMMAEGPKELKSLHEQTERLAASLNLAEADKVGMLARDIDEFKVRIGSDIGQLRSRLDTIEKTLEEFKRAQNIKVVK
jgi:hypothetical protein